MTRRDLAHRRRGSATDSVPAALLRGEVHLILANPPWRQLQERAQKILGDKKHGEARLSRSYCVVQFNIAHKLPGAAYPGLSLV